MIRCQHRNQRPVPAGWQPRGRTRVGDTRNCHGAGSARRPDNFCPDATPAGCHLGDLRCVFVVMGSRTREAREKNGRKADPSVTAAPRRRRGLRMALTGAALLALWWFLPPWMARRALKSAGLPVTSSIALAGFGVSAHQLVLTPSPVQFCGCCAAPYRWLWNLEDIRLTGGQRDQVTTHPHCGWPPHTGKYGRCRFRARSALLLEIAARANAHRAPAFLHSFCACACMAWITWARTST